MDTIINSHAIWRETTEDRQSAMMHGAQAAARHLLRRGGRGNAKQPVELGLCTARRRLHRSVVVVPSMHASVRRVRQSRPQPRHLRSRVHMRPGIINALSIIQPLS